VVFDKLDFYNDFEGFSTAELVDVFTDAKDINGVDKFGESPLIFACKKMDLELVIFLIEAGANPNFISKKGEAPLHSIINLVEDNEILAISIAEYLLEKKANIELRGEMMKTPFLKACCRGSLDMLKLLVSRGCDYCAFISENNEKTTGSNLADIFDLSKEIRSYLRGLLIRCDP